MNDNKTDYQLGFAVCTKALCKALSFQLQDVHDEMFGPPVDRAVQLVKPELVLQEIFLLVVDLQETPKTIL